MPPKKLYFGIKPFDEKRKKKYREPSIAEAFDAGQIRYYGLHAVSSLLGLLPRMKRSQLKELDKWTKVHYKLPIFKKSEPLPEPEIIKQVEEPRDNLDDPNDILYTVCGRLYRYYNTLLKNGTGSNEDQRLKIARLTYRYRDWAKKIKDENPSVKLIDDKIRNLDSKYLNDRMLEIWYEKQFLHNKYGFSEDNEVNQVRYAIDYEKKIVPMIRDMLKPKMMNI
jgi:hypothetical protein